VDDEEEASVEHEETKGFEVKHEMLGTNSKDVFSSLSKLMAITVGSIGRNLKFNKIKRVIKIIFQFLLLIKE
jgi:hypothetical protein